VQGFKVHPGVCGRGRLGLQRSWWRQPPEVAAAAVDGRALLQSGRGTEGGGGLHGGCGRGKGDSAGGALKRHMGKVGRVKQQQLMVGCTYEWIAWGCWARVCEALYMLAFISFHAAAAAAAVALAGLACRSTTLCDVCWQ
jgi:hypothetical protein